MLKEPTNVCVSITSKLCFGVVSCLVCVQSQKGGMAKVGFLWFPKGPHSKDMGSDPAQTLHTSLPEEGAPQLKKELSLGLCAYFHLLPLQEVPHPWEFWPERDVPVNPSCDAAAHVGRQQPAFSGGRSSEGPEGSSVL